MVIEGVKKEYEDKITELLSEYKRLHEEYNKVNKEIEDLKNKLSELELEGKDLQVDLRLARDEEQTFFDDLMKNDFKAYTLIKENINLYITKQLRK